MPNSVSFAALHARSIVNRQRVIRRCQSTLKSLVNLICSTAATDYYMWISGSGWSVLCYCISLLIQYSILNLMSLLFEWQYAVTKSSIHFRYSKTPCSYEIYFNLFQLSYSKCSLGNALHPKTQVLTDRFDFRLFCKFPFPCLFLVRMIRRLY